jgi:hypothetical protein
MHLYDVAAPQSGTHVGKLSLRSDCEGQARERHMNGGSSTRL